MAVPTVTQRVYPLSPSVDTFTDLQALIDRRLEKIEADLDDDEISAAFGIRLAERRAVYLDIAFAIREAVADEQVRDAFTSQEDRIDQLAKLSGADEEWERLRESGADELTLRRLGGDR